MSALVSTDVRAEILRYLEDKARMERYVALRADIPLPILLDSVARFLQKAETETAEFIQSLPDIDPETLDRNHRNCAICWDGFKLQSKSKKFLSSSLSEREITPLRLPCAHIICKACIQGWLTKSGTCPFCHHQWIRQEFLGTCDIQRRESYKEFVELASEYLATIKPEINTYGEFAAWAMIEDDSKDFSLRILRIRAQFMIWKFNEFPTTFEERMLQISETYGRRRVLSPMRRLIDHNEEDEEQINKEGDSMANEGGAEEQQNERGDYTEEGEFKGLAYADEVLEEYGSTDEELADDDDDDDDDADDDDGGELLHESKDTTATSSGAPEMGEREEKENATNDDYNGGQLTEYTHSQMIMYPFEREVDTSTASTASASAYTSTSAVAAVATVSTAMLEEKVVKDPVNGDKDEEGNVKLTTEIVEEEKGKENGWVCLRLVGFVVLGWFAILMVSEKCTC